MINLEDYNYNLPEELIASYPEKKRDNSKLLITSKLKRDYKIDQFYNLINYLDSSIHLVFNDARVLKARLFGKKTTGGKVEIFLDQIVDFDKNRWKIIGKRIQKLKTGDKVIFQSGVEGVLYKDENNSFIEFSIKYDNFDNWLKLNGHLPLPPYILKKRGSEMDEDIDQIRYQTVYAKESGAVAAPTAGLHFTDDILKKLDQNGVTSSMVTLFVGLGTFMPIKTDNILDHKMHSENFIISPKSAEEINKAKKMGKKIVAVGTTSLRALEAVADQNGVINPTTDHTELFIYPGYKFKIVDGLITNFHLPKSTLLLLVSALHGKDNIFDLYKNAIENQFRFYSYGDAMYIKP